MTNHPYGQCPAFTKAGKRCQIGREPDSRFCHVHMRQQPPRPSSPPVVSEPRPAYQDYIQSSQWSEKKRSYRRIMQMLCADHCSVCDSAESLELHHQTYERLGSEDFEDLCLLCHNCHQALHVLQKEWGYELERALLSVRNFRAQNA